MAGLVNAISGEGVQYALLSGKWAVQTVAECIRKSDCSEAAFQSFVQKVHSEASAGFETSAFIVQLIRNRNLNPLWLKTFETIVAKAKTDPNYAVVAGGILPGAISPTKGLTPQFILSTIEEATLANTIRIVQKTINDPTSLPKNIIRITQTGMETAINAIQNPLNFLEWSNRYCGKND